ncbi:MAG: valine--tRNA ligase [Flavobacteriales bacterium]|jgi:valyl-tRNA synthetase|nr:valine--tRNA ligase [Flavobacteriales bacterium]
MELASKYSPNEIENKWYAFWMDQKIFESKPDHREAFTIVIPPPNVTGVLHMGHMLNNTIQDVLIRRARMMGKNACWVPGTDHASIATESKVVAKLASEGIDKKDLTREEFLKHAFEWKDKHGGIILEQLKKLGASCDWSRTTFTMDEDYSEHVIHAFIDLYNKGKIYRGTRMVNWDPKALTALSDEEVIYSEENSKLYHIKYAIEGSEEFLTIATTRPETLLGDTAICINPNDERYQHLKGKKAIVPLVNRVIPIIEDEYVDMEFGTGCLKVTPAHDLNDYDLGKKHQLETINILTEDGKLNKNAQLFVGQDRFEARKSIAKELENQGILLKAEDYQNKVGRSERSNAVVEPRLSMQWFCSMKEMAEPALKNVLDDTIKFHPENTKNTYRHWMENIKDWCISRQLWWGHQIPAFYYGEGENDFVVAKTIEEALPLAQEKTGNTALTTADLKQDEDALDTWFSSWLWPMGVFSKEELDYYYPGETIVTGPDIIFFWIARMIMAGYEYKDEKPFKNVYFTGLIRDGLGRKMSKSLGNSPDALGLIERYGADGVRAGLLLTSAAGNDLKFESVDNKDGSVDYPLCEQGRNFNNKLWNALRLTKMWESEEKETPASNEIAIQWFGNKLAEITAFVNKNFDNYRVSDALKSLYKLIWNDFCSQYLEAIKPAYGDSIDQATLDKTTYFFEELMKLLHPFMPFISEEIWHKLGSQKEGKTIMEEAWADHQEFDEQNIKDLEHIFQINTQVRAMRASKGISPRESMEVFATHADFVKPYAALVQKLANVSQIHFDAEKPQQAFSFRIDGSEYFIPANENINVEEELKKLQDELKRTQGSLNGVLKKLSNERFMANAPEKVVILEKKKKSDMETKIQALQEQIAGLS